MVTSIFDPEIRKVLNQARSQQKKSVNVDGKTVTITKPYSSPADWRDQWIYFLMVDRFHNPDAPPRHLPFDAKFGGFQGGNLKGVRQQLPYLKSLGAGAIWITPVLQNCQWQDGTYHGYGIQNFIRIDPRFGTEQDLQDLVDEAHARGIYVILDIVINHAGDVFEYQGHGSEASFQDFPYDPICWRKADGAPRWCGAPPRPDDPELTPAAAVLPVELLRNECFRRQGSRLSGTVGDFLSLKEFRTDFPQVIPPDIVSFPVRNTLIAIYQYVIARFDIDGYRIDTLKHVERGFARVFGNAMREFALSIGKKNFFTFGEVFDNEEQLAHYTGRFASDSDDLIGVDAALDFPLRFTLPDVVKGFKAPAHLANLYEYRKRVQRGATGQGVLISSHGEASQFFTTFLDNHDQNSRFRYAAPDDPKRFDPQVSIGVGCLFALLGIPVLYYGTEQGLHGAGDSDQNVREALWGKPSAFDTNHSLYKAIQQIATVRARQPALRYGRQYFRGVSGSGAEFGISTTAPGIVAFSRILNDQEVVILANTFINTPFSGFVIVDFGLNPDGSAMQILYSNQGATATPPGPVTTKALNTVIIHELDGSITHGPLRVLPFALKPMEIQILGQKA